MKKYAEKSAYAEASANNADAADADAITASQRSALLLDSAASGSGFLPSHSRLQRELGLGERISPSSISLTMSLPMRVHRRVATLNEKALWSEYLRHGRHELLSSELIAALADHIKVTLSAVDIRRLNTRADLNGQRARVIGPRDAKTGRVPVRIEATGETVTARPRNLFDGSGGERWSVAVLTYCISWLKSTTPPTALPSSLLAL